MLHPAHRFRGPRRYGALCAREPDPGGDRGLAVGRLSRRRGLEERFARDELYIADEVVMTGTAAELTPIREVDDRTVGTGKPGPVTRDLQSAFFDIVLGRDAKHASWLSPL